MSLTRRSFVQAGAAWVAAGSVAPGSAAPTTSQEPADGQGTTVRRNQFAVSTYSFWQFRRRDLRSIETCIDLAASWGFDGVEILHRQMAAELL